MEYTKPSIEIAKVTGSTPLAASFDASVETENYVKGTNNWTNNNEGFFTL